MEQSEAIRLYHDEGMTLRQVADRLGISAERVRQILNASGKGTRKRQRRGLMPNTLPTSLRLSAQAGRMLQDLEKRLGLKRSAIMELAIRKLHQAEVAGSMPSELDPSPTKPRGRPRKDQGG